MLIFGPFGLAALWDAASALAGLCSADGGALGDFVFSMTLAVFSFGVLFVGYRARSQRQREATRLERHPDQPWLANEAWAAGRIEYSELQGDVAVRWAVGMVFILAAPPCLTLTLNAFGEGRYLLGLVASLFVGLSILPLLSAIASTIIYLKTSPSVFEMASVPAPIGGRLCGVVHSRLRLHSVDAVRLTLRCVRRTRASEDDPASDTDLWRTEDTVTPVPSSRDPGRVEIPVQFAISADSRPTQKMSDTDEVLWRMEVRTSTNSVPYEAWFDVPVFALGDGPARRT